MSKCSRCGFTLPQDQTIAHMPEQCIGFLANGYWSLKDVAATMAAELAELKGVRVGFGDEFKQFWDRRGSAGVYILVERRPGERVALKGRFGQHDLQQVWLQPLVEAGGGDDRRVLRMDIRAWVRGTQNPGDHTDLTREMPELEGHVEVVK